MTNVTRFPLLLCVLFLMACNGQAPIITCPTPCKDAKESRDLFCVCRYYPPATGGQGPGPTETVGVPSLDFEWEATPSCSLNRRYYVQNSDSHPWVVTINFKVPNSATRQEIEKTVKAKAFLHADGVDLGYEEVGSTCFDKDFGISRWRRPQHSTAEETVQARLADQREVLIARSNASIERLMPGMTIAAKGLDAIKPRAQMRLAESAVVQTSVKQVQPLDCPSVCDSNDGVLCPLRGYPPDQEKLKLTRDRLRQEPTASGYSAASIYSIFGLAKASCDRTDVAIVNSRLFNKGQYCALPMFFRDTDSVARMALHLPTSVKGSRIARSNGASGIAFVAGTAQPQLLFSEADLHTDFGGFVTEATASDKGVYYQSTSSCIFVGIK